MTAVRVNGAVQPKLSDPTIAKVLLLGTVIASQYRAERVDARLPEVGHTRPSPTTNASCRTTPPSGSGVAAVTWFLIASLYTGFSADAEVLTRKEHSPPGSATRRAWPTAMDDLAACCLVAQTGVNCLPSASSS